ncbi:hypothetical protein ABK040_005483 [Willaertia magna]
MNEEDLILVTEEQQEDINSLKYKLNNHLVALEELLLTTSNNAIEKIDQTNNGTQGNCATLPDLYSGVCGSIPFNVTRNVTSNYEFVEKFIEYQVSIVLEHFYVEIGLNMTERCNSSVTNFMCSNIYKRCFQDGKVIYSACDSVCRNVFDDCFQNYFNQTFAIEQEYQTCGKPSKPVYPFPPQCTNIFDKTQDIILLVALIGLLLLLIGCVLVGGIMSFVFYRKQAQREREKGYSSIETRNY